MSQAISVCHGDFGRAALYQLNKTIVTHAHREGHLIFHLSGNFADVAVGDGVFLSDQKTAVAVSPWEPHSFHVGAGDQGVCTCLVLYIKPMWFLEAARSAEFALNFGRSTILLTEGIKRWVTRLTSLLLEEESVDMFDSLLFETTRLCFEQSWSGQGEVQPISMPRARFTDYRVRRSLRLMQERFMEDVEIDLLARDVGLSRPHFFKLFKKHMGVTPNIYLNTLRAEQAIEDLLTTEKTVTDIGYDLGFSSQASFTRFFASNVGIPPSEYRRVAHIS